MTHCVRFTNTNSNSFICVTGRDTWWDQHTHTSQVFCSWFTICCEVCCDLVQIDPWRRHQMESFSALPVLCAGNSPVTGEFPAQRPVMRSFDSFFYKRFGKQSWGWCFETPSRSLWRHSGLPHRLWDNHTVCPCATETTLNITEYIDYIYWNSESNIIVYLRRSSTTFLYFASMFLVV